MHDIGQVVRLAEVLVFVERSDGQNHIGVSSGVGHLHVHSQEEIEIGQKFFEVVSLRGPVACRVGENGHHGLNRIRLAVVFLIACHLMQQRHRERRGHSLEPGSGPQSGDIQDEGGIQVDAREAGTIATHIARQRHKDGNSPTGLVAIVVMVHTEGDVHRNSIGLREHAG